MIQACFSYFTPQMFAAKMQNAENEGWTLPCTAMADHLVAYTPGWSQTIEYAKDDTRLPDAIREFSRLKEWDAMVATPMVLGGRMLGWMTMLTPRIPFVDYTATAAVTCCDTSVVPTAGH